MDKHRDPRWTVVLLVVALTALVLAGAALATARDRSPESTAVAAGPSAPAAPATAEIVLGDLYVQPATVEVAAGTGMLFVTNTGALPHDLAVEGTSIGTPMLGPAEQAVLDVSSLAPGTYTMLCTVPGHAAAGMVGRLIVAGGTEPAVAAADGAVAHPGEPPSTGAVIDWNAAPSAEWTPFDAALAPAPGGTEHVVTLEATEVVLEVAPGLTQEMWTFNDQVPGPILRGKVGDLFTVTLVNRGQLGHSIDFHASKVAWNDEMRTIQPGESLIYQFEAKHAGIFMYHCGTAPALHHIGNGMFGAVIIDPPDLPPVDHEFVLVQSEIYTGPEGEPGDLAKMQTDAWDAVVFNGYVNQYLHAPIRVEPGERVRVWVLDAGPSENSSFHIVGTVFDTVYKEGAYRLQPGSGRGGAQALDLQPSQGGFVEFTFDEDGLYPLVTHKFSNVGKGALGLFAAGDVDTAGAGH